MKWLLAVALLLIPTRLLALDCYIASQVVPYSGFFHDDTNTVVNPTSPTAAVRITPFAGTATYAALATPAQLNSVVGWYGGEYTISGSPTLGSYEITLKGDVPTSKTIAAVVARFQVRSACPTSTFASGTDTVTLAAATHTGAVIPTVTTLTGHTPQTGDSYAIVNGANGLVAIKGDTAAILADTNELQTDWANGGRLDLLIDGIKAKTDQLTFGVTNTLNVNPTYWLNAAIATPTTPGVPKTEVVSVGDGALSSGSYASGDIPLGMTGNSQLELGEIATEVQRVLGVIKKFTTHATLSTVGSVVCNPGECTETVANSYQRHYLMCLLNGQPWIKEIETFVTTNGGTFQISSGDKFPSEPDATTCYVLGR